MATIAQTADGPRLGGRRMGRLAALTDLGLWLVSIGLMELGGLLWLSKAPLTAKFVVGEPMGMVILLAASTAILRWRGQTWRELGLAAPESWRRTFRVAALGLLAVVCVNASLVLLVLHPLHIADPNLKIMIPVISSPLTYATLVGLSWTTVAFGEELQFRGFLFSRLEALFGRSRVGTAAAWLGQGVLFGLPHIYQGPGGAITTAGIGLVMGAMYLLNRRNLAANILLHAVIDTLSLTALFMLHSRGLI